MSTTNPDEPPDTSKYTQEAKIVAAVWVHEKTHNNQTWKDINNNFRIRFKTAPPNRSTLLNWEKKLFATGSVEDKEKCGRPLSRLMHVPYVKESLDEAPHLSVRERAKELGLSRTTLLKIMKEDLNMEFEVEDDGSTDKSIKRKHAPFGGKWKAKKEAKEECNNFPALDEAGSSSFF